MSSTNLAEVRLKGVGKSTPVAVPTPPSSLFRMSASATDETSEGASAEATPSSSGFFTPTTPKLSLEETFPAILTPVNLLRRLHTPDVDSLRSLAQIFAQCLGAIVYSVDQLPYRVRLNTTYEMARHGVLFTLYLFTAQIGQVDPGLSGLEVKDAHLMALQLLDMTMASLRSFFEVAERALAGSKPLPNLPDQTVDLPPIVEGATASVLDGATRDPSDEGESTLTTTLTASDEQAASLASTDDAQPTIAPKVSKIARLLACVGNASTRSNASAAKSTSTLINPPHDSTRPTSQESKMGSESPQSETETLQDDNVIQIQKSHARSVYSIRQSLLIFPDPQEPKTDVEMPRPVGDAFDMNLNEHGVIVGASLSALVRILTSKDAVTDCEFTEMFFVCFRFFSSPMEVFDKLVGRYDEQPPGPLTAAQSRVWDQEARLVKFRVAKVLLTWVDLHWRQELDKDVFDPLLNFTFKRMATDLPLALSRRVAEALHQCAGAGQDYRGSRLRRRLEMQHRALKWATRPSTGFKLPSKKDPRTGGFSVLGILDFDSAAGRGELAIQLTIRASRLYRQFDPEDAVIFWRDGQNVDVGRTISDVIDFEKSICFFVTNSILDRPTPVARAGIAGFWIDVASRCVQLRNFSVGASILGGIQCPSVDRLMHTVLHLTRPHQEQYIDLCRMFCLFSNLRGYRAALRSSETPAVPLLSSLIHDIKVTKEVKRSGHLSDDIEKPVINISSYRVVTKTLRAMELCHVPYNLASVDYIQDWLVHALTEYAAVSDDVALAQEFLSRSLVLEAKDPNLKDMTWLKASQYICEETEARPPEAESRKLGAASFFSFKFMTSAPAACS